MEEAPGPWPITRRQMETEPGGGTWALARFLYTRKTQAIPCLPLPGFLPAGLSEDRPTAPASAKFLTLQQPIRLLHGSKFLVVFRKILQTVVYRGTIHV